jgi:hypothetical protein
MTAPRRRWSFTLRTLFVVMTVTCIVGSWIGYELRFIQQRRMAIAQTRALKGGSDSGTISFWRLWLGDQAVPQLFLNSGATGADIERLGRLFPEARISRVEWAEERGLRSHVIVD